MRSHLDARRLGWDTYIRAPIHRLHKFLLLLKTSSKHNVGISQASDKETILRLRGFVQVCDIKVADTLRQIEDRMLRDERGDDSDLHIWRPTFANRSIKQNVPFRGDLYMHGHHRMSFLSSWLKVHAILYDDCLVLATEGSSDTRQNPGAQNKLQRSMKVLYPRRNNPKPSYCSS